VRRRYLVAAIAAGFLATAGLVAALALVLLPDPGTAAEHAAATPHVSATFPAANRVASTGLPSTTAAIPVTPSSLPDTSAPVPATNSTAAGPARLAGRIRPGVTYSGVATSYPADGGGACMYDPSGDLMVAALNQADFEASKACGAYLQVQGPSGASVTVRVTDRCPQCAVGAIDLSAQAFARLAAPSTGRIAVTWKLLSPSTSRTVGIRYKTGSSRNWCAIQVLDHRNPLALLEVRSGTTWRQLPRSDFNYFVSADGSGCGGTIRVTDIYGQRLVLSGFTVKPGTVQTSRLQFSRH
jgi:expansin (peptidoglycan-binding protein)